MHSLPVKSQNRTEFIDITKQIQTLVSNTLIQEGLCFVYCPHTTAGLTINENADPDVQTDLENYFDAAIPWKNQYLHQEGNTAAHIKASLIGASVSVPIHNGQLMLGTWQGIYFCEFDGPRTRKILITFIEAT